MALNACIFSEIMGSNTRVDHTAAGSGDSCQSHLSHV